MGSRDVEYFHFFSSSSAISSSFCCSSPLGIFFSFKPSFSFVTSCSILKSASFVSCYFLLFSQILWPRSTLRSRGLSHERLTISRVAIPFEMTETPKFLILSTVRVQRSFHSRGFLRARNTPMDNVSILRCFSLVAVQSESYVVPYCWLPGHVERDKLTWPLASSALPTHF